MSTHMNSVGNSISLCMDDQYLFLEFHFPINICRESVLYAAILDKAKVSRKLEHIAVFFKKKKIWSLTVLAFI